MEADVASVVATVVATVVSGAAEERRRSWRAYSARVVVAVVAGVVVAARGSFEEDTGLVMLTMLGSSLITTTEIKNGFTVASRDELVAGVGAAAWAWAYLEECLLAPS